MAPAPHTPAQAGLPPPLSEAGDRRLPAEVGEPPVALAGDTLGSVGQNPPWGAGDSPGLQEVGHWGPSGMGRGLPGMGRGLPGMEQGLPGMGRGQEWELMGGKKGIRIGSLRAL